MKLQLSKTGWQKAAVGAFVIAMFCLGAWTSGASPDEERIGMEMEALKRGYQTQIEHAYNEYIDELAVKGRSYAYGRFQKRLGGIRTAFKDCREIVKGTQR
jgi:hypothetical protein